MTGLLSPLMVGIYCRFVPFGDIWMMEGDFSDRGCGVRAVMGLRGFLMYV